MPKKNIYLPDLARKDKQTISFSHSFKNSFIIKANWTVYLQARGCWYCRA